MIMTLEDEIAESIAKDIAKEIDDGIMVDLLKDIGWTSVEFSYKDNYHAVDVTHWLMENCPGKWRRLSSFYVFEDIKEAEWFILRWI